MNPPSISVLCAKQSFKHSIRANELRAFHSFIFRQDLLYSAGYEAFGGGGLTSDCPLLYFQLTAFRRGCCRCGKWFDYFILFFFFFDLVWYVYQNFAHFNLRPIPHPCVATRPQPQPFDSTRVERKSTFKNIACWCYAGSWFKKFTVPRLRCERLFLRGNQFNRALNL